MGNIQRKKLYTDARAIHSLENNKETITRRGRLREFNIKKDYIIELNRFVRKFEEQRSEMAKGP